MVISQAKVFLLQEIKAPTNAQVFLSMMAKTQLSTETRVKIVRSQCMNPLQMNDDVPIHN